MSPDESGTRNSKELKKPLSNKTDLDKAMLRIELSSDLVAIAI